MLIKPESTPPKALGYHSCMSRFTLRLFKVLTAFSLVLFITATAAWARSYFARDSVGLGLGHIAAYAEWSEGTLVLDFAIRAPQVPAAQYLMHWHRAPEQIVPRYFHLHESSYLDVRWSLGSYGYSGAARNGIGWRTLFIPFAVVCVLSVLLPLRWLALEPLRRRERRRLSGRCASCGYDLRASTDRCPECGLPVGAAPPDCGPWTWVSMAIAIIAISPALAIACMLIPGGMGSRMTWVTYAPLHVGWQGAIGRGPGRMGLADPDPFSNRFAHAIWRHDGKDYLILMRPSGMAASYHQWWYLSLLDRNMQVVRCGKVGIPNIGGPYCLVEAQSNDATLPSALRDRWTFAIGVQRYRGIDESRPLHLGINLQSVKRANELEVDLVEWDDLPSGFVDPLSHLLNNPSIASIQYRLAEDSLAIAPATNP
jgi:hypothetical protein